MCTRRTLAAALSIWLSVAFGCKPKIPEPEPSTQPAPVTLGSTAPAEPSAAEPIAPTPSPGPVTQPPREGWRAVSAQNNLPLCVFASESDRANTKAVEQVKPQVLGADQPVVFGVFAPRCIHPECDELTSLQCSVERSGNILRLQSSYDGLHKDGAACRDNCREATAGCQSAVLEPGAYTLEYGGTQIPLKIPSALNMPCFKSR